MTPPLSYIPLHVHSDASLDGAGTVTSLVAQAAKLKMRGLALTDHGTLANAVAFWSACTEHEIRPILGIEAYFQYRAKRHHITLLSYNETGFNNLIAMDTESHSFNYTTGYPLMDMNMLEKHKEGVIALTGCASSALYHGEFSDCMNYVGDLMDIYDRQHLYLEVMFVGSQNTWGRPLDVQRKVDLWHVITNDTHYPCREQFPAHQAICAARRGFTYNSEHLWLKTADEIAYEGRKYIGEYELVEGLANTIGIWGMVEEWNMKAPPSLPHIPDVEEILERELVQRWKADYATAGGKNERLDRLRREFGVLRTKGFLDYIYILWDIVSWAKGQEIVVGPGRGSGSGSYLLYLLGITGVDPLVHGLLFERFLNPGRSDYPDVDVDFEADRRQEVLHYAHERWGTIPIATYYCYSHKSAVHDIARILTIPKDLEVPAAEGGLDSEDFHKFINDKPDALVVYETMVGQIRHRGKHAAGVIVPNRPVPLERMGDQLVAAWAEGTVTKELSKVGIVKYDILGLTALNQLKMMAGMSGHPFPERLNDPNVFDLFCVGDVSGIFQWSGSDGIKELTMRIAPRNFYDLTTCNALYRPGALDAGTAKDYPEFMKKPRLLHPDIDRHLQKTFGVICYQEQVMSVVAEVMGGDLGEADLARRLLSKAAVGDPKWEREIEELHGRFWESGRKKGMDEVLLAKLWSEVYTHSRYSYNLSHATTYTMISYRMAWYKVYHRPAFTAAVLQYDRANAQTYILDAIEHDMEVVMPHINFSSTEYEVSVVEGRMKIFLPLTDVSFLGEKSIAYILDNRQENGPFLSYEDFGKRIPRKLCNNRTKGLMERIGAFAGLEGDPASIIEKYTELPILEPYETQLEILKYVIPTKELLGKINTLRTQPAKKGYLRFAGFISTLEKKKSDYGEYTVFKLSPFGSFWCRTPSAKLRVGAFVSGTKSKFGQSSDVKVYRLS